MFHRNPAPGEVNLPVLRERAEMAATEARFNEIIPIVKPDILHAHSPVLNTLPAIRAGRRHGIPVNCLAPRFRCPSPKFCAIPD